MPASTNHQPLRQRSALQKVTRCCCCWLCGTMFVILIVLIIAGVVVSQRNGGDYLYHIEEAEGIIFDYNDTSNEQPDFLYAPNQGPRVVEFYAPWCPHCQHFREHYIQFAEQMRAVTDEFNGPHIQFHAVSCTAHRKICRDMGINGFPKVKLFSTGQTISTDMKYWKLHPFDVLTALGIQADRQHLLPVIQATSGKNATQLRKERVQLGYARSKQEVFDDAYLSFDFNMRTGIFTGEGPLPNATKDVLEDWLELLKQSTPAVWQLQLLLKDIQDNFDWVVQSEENLVSILDKHPPPKKKWSSSCVKGLEGMGYTCGLWQLFHMMTVGVVEYNSMIGMSDDGLLGELAITTVHAAETLRNFIQNFFQCDYCRTNFLHAYDSCEHNRCTRLSGTTHDFEQWIQLPVWLFETHNSVNARLVREKAERQKKTVTDEEVGYSQWPSKTDCTHCWREDGAYDDNMVYYFLRTEYWSEDAVTAEHRALLTPHHTVVLETPPRFPFELFPFFGGLVICALWYSKRSKMHRTGQHKKVDGDEC